MNTQWTGYSNFVKCVQLPDMQEPLLVSLTSNLAQHDYYLWRVGWGREPWERSEAVELMIMNDTCATHQSQVPRRSSGRIKGGATTVEDERGQAWTLFCVLLCSSHLWGAAAFILCLFIFLLKYVYVHRFPPPPFRSTNGAFPLHGTARYGTVRFTFGGFSTAYCTWYLILF